MTEYELSNSIDVVKLNCFDKTYYKKLLGCGDDASQRQKCAQDLVDYLCRKFKIVSVKTYVIDTPQPHATNDKGNLRKKTLGLYTYSPSGRPQSIKLWQQTAARQQIVSIKTFAGTLLHEFMHHYDVQVLHIKTMHTAGFYKRISDLQNKLQ